MGFGELFSTIQQHLTRHGIASTPYPGKPITPKAIARAESKMKINLPSDLREFYQTVGDGFFIYWSAENEPTKPSGILEIPTLSRLAKTYLSPRAGLYTADGADEYGFPYTTDPELAKRTAARMWHWLPLIEEGNGDEISLDLSEPTCPVVFNRHDWLDGGSGDNGHHLAPNMRDFLFSWGSVCFQSPKSLYWPSCFRPEGGVNWDGDEFVEPFRISGLSKDCGH